MSNCICIYVDEVATMLEERTRRARKPHECGECGETIEPGSLYLYEREVFEGNISVHKTCARCANVRKDYFSCGWYWGQLRDDFYDAHGFDYTKGIPADFAPCGRREA